MEQPEKKKNATNGDNQAVQYRFSFNHDSSIPLEQ